MDVIGCWAPPESASLVPFLAPLAPGSHEQPLASRMWLASSSPLGMDMTEEIVVHKGERYDESRFEMRLVSACIYVFSKDRKCGRNDPITEMITYRSTNVANK